MNFICMVHANQNQIQLRAPQSNNIASETQPTISDKVAYPSCAHPQSHPNQLAAKALLYGMSPAPIERFRVLE